MLVLLLVVSGTGCSASGRQSPTSAPSPSASNSLTHVKVDLARTYLAREGFAGLLYEPDVVPDRALPGVLVIGGSEGGVASGDLATAIAAHGYPTLAIAYFGLRGLPRQLEDIPLEYFVHAARWLRSQPGVAHRLIVIGISRGSEAAEQLAYLDPEDVRGVVASVPSDVRVCGIPDCAGPAWTWRHRVLPFTRQFDEPRPTDAPHAVIPLYRAHANVLLICAGADQVWSSCAYAQAIQQQLSAHHYDWPHSLLRYPRADHYVGGLVPGVSLDQYTTDTTDDEKAREALWPHLLAFLRGIA